MDGLERVIMVITSILLIVGGYQFYFLPQRKPIREHTEWKPGIIDRMIPFYPGWVWVYSGLYYPVIIILVFAVSSFQDFNYTAFSFIILLALQLCFFYFYPVATPQNWRDYKGPYGASTKFLKFVQQQDNRQNCFPSMHSSVAMLTALHLFEKTDLGVFAPLVFLFPVLIGLSTLFTKQHYFIDVPAGILLGWATYQLYLLYA